jgi:hypothetical protein
MSHAQIQSSNVPLVSVCPPLRCYERITSSPLHVCGRIAAWKRPGAPLFGEAFFCDHHAQAGDVPIGGEQLARRVRIRLDVLLSGAAQLAPLCHTEAAARLEAAVIDIGGLLDVHDVTSNIVRYGACSPQGRVFGE